MSEYGEFPVVGASVKVFMVCREATATDTRHLAFRLTSKLLSTEPAAIAPRGGCGVVTPS